MNKLDYTALWFWINVIWMAANAALWLYTLLSKRRQVTANRFAELEKQVATCATTTDVIKLETDLEHRCERHQARTSNIELSIASMPTRPEVNKLSDQISRLNGSLQEFSGRLQGINRAVDLMNECLMNQGQKP